MDQKAHHGRNGGKKSQLGLLNQLRLAISLELQRVDHSFTYGSFGLVRLTLKIFLHSHYNDVPSRKTWAFLFDGARHVNLKKLF